MFVITHLVVFSKRTITNKHVPKCDENADKISYVRSITRKGHTVCPRPFLYPQPMTQLNVAIGNRSTNLQSNIANAPVSAGVDL